jgi:hypothetical protein
MTTARGPQVERWASILVGVAVVGLIGWITYDQTANPRIKKERDAGADAAGASSAASSSGSASSSSGASTTSTTTTSSASGGPPPIDDGDAGGFFSLPFDLGDAAPAGGPRVVRIGVVLVQYQGAEGAGTNTRKKPDALALAQRLAGEAKTDFRKAVGQGDPGSAEDIGRIPRGTLDPRTEGVVWGLTKGDVSDVLETPRGFWIVKRND